MPQEITIEQAVAVIESHTAKLRQTFGLATPVVPGDPASARGFTYISESERDWYGREVCDLAIEACGVWSRPNFSAKRWFESARKSVRLLRMRESQPESAFAFLLRKGVQTLANDWYNTVEREWKDYCLVGNSSNMAEWYAPLYGSTVAARVARGDRFPEGKVVGEDSVVVNYKFGMIESFERELFDDDQTGQIRNRTSALGSSMGITENAYAAIRFIGAAGVYANLSVPASGYTTTNPLGATITGPFSTTLFGAVGNRPAAYVALGLNALKAAWSALLNAKDPLGNKIIVRPDTLLVSAMDALHAPLLVAPPAGVPYYPAPIGASTQTAATAASGFPGGAFGANPFLGLGIKPVVARFLPDWAWALGERGKGFLFQERDPLEVIQEAAGSGSSFEVDAYRFRSRRRFEAEWIAGGSRFWYLGNDGTTAGAF